MTPIAEMVRRMLEKGVTHEAIVMAVEGAEQAMSDRNSGGIPVDAVAEKRRAYDRQRKRKSTGIPPDSTGTPRNSENAYISKEDKKESNKEEREAPKRNFRGQRLPDDWHPTPQDQATAVELIGEDRSRVELEKFRDHWKQQAGSKGVKLDWNAAWRNWIRNAAEYGARNVRRTGHVRTDSFTGSPPTGDDAVVTGMARALERRRAARGAIDPGRPEFRADGGAGFTGGNAAEPPAASGDGGAHRMLAVLPRRDLGE